MIKIKNLSKKFGEFLALRNLNLEIKKGELFGFLGPNGAGKTTTIRILAGLSRPTEGWVFIALRGASNMVGDSLYEII